MTDFEKKQFSKEKADTLTPADAALLPPPPYTGPSPPAPGRPIMFPRELVFHSRYTSTMSYVGASKDEPLYGVRAPCLWSCFTNPDHQLLDGLSKDSRVIATVGSKKGSWGTKTLIRVAPDRAGVAVKGKDYSAFTEITMPRDNGSTHAVSVPLANGRFETFEWRNTRGDEVRALSGGYTQGWKLLRMDGPPVVPGSTPGGTAGYSSDGKEVVAVAAQPRLFQRDPRFAFLGRGATGEFGPTFEIVAVMGFLRLYELSVQQAAAASAGGAS